MKRYRIFPMIVLCIIALSASATEYYTDEIGSMGGFTSTAQAGYSWGFDIIANNTGCLNSIGLNVYNNHEIAFRLAIYNDSNDIADSVLWEGDSTVVANGWNDFETSPIFILNGSRYWLAYQAYVDWGSDTLYYIIIPGQKREGKDNAYGPFQNPFNPSYEDDVIANMRMNYSSYCPTTTTSSTTTVTTLLMPVTLEYSVDNFNTLAPIEKANVTLRGISSISRLTDSYGIADFTVETGLYNVSVVKSGYESYSSYDYNASMDSTLQIYLIQSSHEGIIRLRLNDLTFSEHDICLFFDNQRLQGCYSPNDTITIHNNMNYTLVPKIYKMDLIQNPESYWLYLPFVLGIAVILTVLSVLSALTVILYRMVRGKK